MRTWKDSVVSRLDGLLGIGKGGSLIKEPSDLKRFNKGVTQLAKHCFDLRNLEEARETNSTLAKGTLKLLKMIPEQGDALVKDFTQELLSASESLDKGFEFRVRIFQLFFQAIEKTYGPEHELVQGIRQTAVNALLAGIVAYRQVEGVKLNEAITPFLLKNPADNSQLFFSFLLQSYKSGADTQKLVEALDNITQLMFQEEDISFLDQKIKDLVSNQDFVSSFAKGSAQRSEADFALINKAFSNIVDQLRKRS